MSLVREALAKAEREAAARTAREKGLPPALADAAQPYRAPRRQRWPWAAALAAATLAGAGAAYLLLGSSVEDRLVSSREALGAARSVATVPSSEEKLSVKGVAGSTPVTETLDATQQQAPSGSATSAEPAPGAERPKRERIPGEKTAPRTEAPSRPQEPFPTGGRGIADPVDPGTGSPPAKAPGPLAGSYVRELALDGGRTIRLGGIAWSDAAPLAYLNGKLRGVGEMVEGWRIAAIERERVLLESGPRRVAVSLR